MSKKSINFAAQNWEYEKDSICNSSDDGGRECVGRREDILYRYR